MAAFFVFIVVTTFCILILLGGPLLFWSRECPRALLAKEEQLSQSQVYVRDGLLHCKHRRNAQKNSGYLGDLDNLGTKEAVQKIILYHHLRPQITRNIDNFASGFMIVPTLVLLAGILAVLLVLANEGQSVSTISDFLRLVNPQISLVFYTIGFTELAACFLYLIQLHNYWLILNDYKSILKD